MISPPASLKPLLECGLAVVARAEIGDERIGLAHAVLVGPGAERFVELIHGERGAHHVGRLGGDDRGRGVHVDHEFLGLRRHVGGGERVGREIVAGEDVRAVAHDHLLRQPLGDVRRDAAGVLADQLDLAAGDGVAVLLHVELDAVVDLRAGIGELAGIGHDHADLDGLLRVRRALPPAWPRVQCRAPMIILTHRCSSRRILFMGREPAGLAAKLHVSGIGRALRRAAPRFQPQPLDCAAAATWASAP